MKCWLGVSLHLRWCPERDPQLQLSCLGWQQHCRAWQGAATSLVPQGLSRDLSYVGVGAEALQGLYEHPESVGAALWAQGGSVGFVVKVGTGNLHSWLLVQWSQEWGINGNMESGLQGLVLATGFL